MNLCIAWSGAWHLKKRTILQWKYNSALTSPSWSSMSEEEMPSTGFWKLLAFRTHHRRLTRPSRRLTEDVWTTPSAKTETMSRKDERRWGRDAWPVSRHSRRSRAPCIAAACSIRYRPGLRHTAGLVVNRGKGTAEDPAFQRCKPLK